MLPKKSPAQSAYLKFKEMFGEDGGTLVIAIQTDNLYTEENFLRWKNLGDSLSKMDGVTSVVSEADLFTIVNNTKLAKFETEPIFQDPTFADKSVNDIRKQIREIPLYNNLLYNDSTHVSLMMVGIDESFLSDQKKSGVVLDVEDIALGYEEYFGKIHFAGLPHIRVVIGKRVVSEMYIFIGLAILVTSLLLYIFFRSFRVVLFCNLVVFTAVIWSLGTIGLFGFKLSILMALIPPLMIVIGIPNCIFLLNKFHREVKDHGNKTKALSRVIQKVGNATFLTNLTTALGFSTFVFTNSEKLIEFGTIASLNIIIVFILSITIIPIVFSLAKSPKPRHLKHLEKTYTKNVVEKLVYLTLNKRKAVYFTTIGVVLLAIYGMTRVEATGNLTSDLPESDPILKDIEFITDNFGGAVPFEIMIDYKEDGRKFNNQMLSKVETVQSILADDTLFSKSISMVDFMKLINMAYYGNNPEKYDLISRKDMRRLGGYVAKFEEDAFRTSRVNRYLDSLNQGNKVYLDSIYQNYPDIQREAIYVLNDGKVDSNYVLTDQALQQIKASENTKSITNKIIEQEYPMPTMAFSLKELIDTSRTTLRIRTQIKDIGSYEIAALSDSLSQKIDAALNPEKQKVEHFYSKYTKGDSTYIDSILDLSNSYYSNLTHLIAGDDEDLLFELDMDPDLLTNYYNDENFQSYMREAIDREYLSFLITGTSVVAAEGTQYLVKNLLTSLAIAIVIIAVLMSLLFQSWRMVIISLVPNFIPLLITAGIMGFFHIPIKPSTILVFSIAFGISVDDTIHFLAKYRQELKDREWDLKQCVLNALRETGVSMFYTSIVLFFGFSMFALSQFGGTQALGLLVSLTLLVAMLTNLAVLPSLLLSLENRIATKAFKEPYINIYDEEIDIDLDDLEVDPKTRKEKPDND
jgi:predicted RND superfamily exporter protein